MQSNPLFWSLYPSSLLYIEDIPLWIFCCQKYSQFRSWANNLRAILLLAWLDLQNSAFPWEIFFCFSEDLHIVYKLVKDREHRGRPKKRNFTPFIHCRKSFSYHRLSFSIVADFLLIFCLLPFHLFLSFFFAELNLSYRKSWMMLIPTFHDSSFTKSGKVYKTISSDNDFMSPNYFPNYYHFH